MANIGFIRYFHALTIKPVPEICSFLISNQLHINATGNVIR